MGVIQGGDTMQALLRLMSNLYAPQFIASSLWPESIKKDFVGELPVAAATALALHAHLSLHYFTYMLLQHQRCDKPSDN